MAAVAAGSPAEEITVRSVAGPVRSAMSIFVPFLGVVLVVRLVRAATPRALGTATRVAMSWAFALALVGTGLTVAVVAIMGGDWSGFR